MENNGVYRTEASSSPVGVTVRLDHIFDELVNIKARTISNLEKSRQELIASKEEYEKPFEYAEKLEKMVKRQVELDNILDITEEQDEFKDYGKLRNEIARKRDAMLAEERELAIARAKAEAEERLKEAEREAKKKREEEKQREEERKMHVNTDTAATGFVQMDLFSTEIVTTKSRKKKNYDIEGQISFFDIVSA